MEDKEDAEAKFSPDGKFDEYILPNRAYGVWAICLSTKAMIVINFKHEPTSSPEELYVNTGV
jgi:hypothetical protein